MFDWVAFDADDTLWKNEEYYRQTRERFLEILEKYEVNLSRSEQIDQIESCNIPYYGYGVMSFILSLIEIGIRVTDQALEICDVQELLDLGKEMLSADVELLDGVEDALSSIPSEAFVMLITKGDLFHQLRKVKSSGLRSYFSAVEVVSEKEPSMYQEIFKKYSISPGKFVMIGNSIRSDILPVLETGGYAIHLADHLTWSHEDDEVSDEYRGRFRSVPGLTEIPAALNGFE